MNTKFNEEAGKIGIYKSKATGDQHIYSAELIWIYARSLFNPSFWIHLLFICKQKKLDGTINKPFN